MGGVSCVLSMPPETDRGMPAKNPGNVRGGRLYVHVFETVTESSLVLTWPDILPLQGRLYAMGMLGVNEER